MQPLISFICKRHPQIYAMILSISLILFSKIRQFLDCNETCIEKGVALFSKRNRKAITVLQFFENSKKNQQQNVLLGKETSGQRKSSRARIKHTSLSYTSF